ncbi:hypothetical protein OAK75_06055 [Bacteriovoracales bacterium]|nr:hypothetical protein [Bacteriovoracales bacterium]
MVRKFRFAALLAILLVVASCGNNGGGGGHNPGTGPTDKVDAFVQILLSEDAILDVEVLKNLEDTKSEGWIVIRPTLKDSYYTGLGAYQPPSYIGYAVNLDNFEVGDSWDDFLLKSAQHNNGPYDDGGYFWLLDNDVEATPYGDFYGSIWNPNISSSISMVFSEEKGPVKDLEKLGAVKEAYATKKVRDLLNFDYGLSEKRSESVAKLVVNWSKVSNKRSMTSSDADAFTEKLIGVNINEASKAYKASLEGNGTSLDSLIETAADVNETSPENMRELFNNLVLNK